MKRNFLLPSAVNVNLCERLSVFKISLWSCIHFSPAKTSDMLANLIIRVSQR